MDLGSLFNDLLNDILGVLTGYADGILESLSNGFFGFIGAYSGVPVLVDLYNSIVTIFFD